MALQAVRVYSHDMQNLPKTSPGGQIAKKERKIISLKALMKEDKILEVKGGVGPYKQFTFFFSSIAKSI